jgi:ABC-type transport system involved in multi-copper enzyme maturation permease subunit
MTSALVIAGLTVREAMRRWIVAACTAIALCLVGLSAWGFDRLSHSHSITSGEAGVAVPQSLILFMFMFSFVVALSASAMASPAISADVESGVLYSIVTRPVRRSEIVMGKWIGLTAVLLAYSALVCGLEMAVVDWVSGFLPPNPAAVWAYLFVEGTLLLTFALFLSTRLSAIATGVIVIALFGAAWLAGVVGALGSTFHISELRTVGQVSRYILPTDGVWHGAIYYLEPQSLITGAIAGSLDARGDPFFAMSPPSWGYLVWVAVWFLLILAAGLLSFQRREF